MMIPVLACHIYYNNIVHKVFKMVNQLQLNKINQDGCFDKLKGDMKNNITILGGVAIGIGFVQVLFMLNSLNSYSVCFCTPICGT